MKKILTSSFLAIALLGSPSVVSAYEGSHVLTNMQNNPGYLNQIASTLADQLGQNKDFADLKNTPIAIMSIVNLENFSEITKTSNIVTENLIHEMQIRGFKVIDFKAMPAIKIGANGDFIFSRDLSDLRNKQNINYALSGTYSTYKGGMAINLRIVNIQNNVVLSSAQVFIPRSVLREVERDSQGGGWTLTEAPVTAPVAPVYSVDIQKR
jgi:flagellar H-ring protein FlgO